MKIVRRFAACVAVLCAMLVGNAVYGGVIDTFGPSAGSALVGGNLVRNAAQTFTAIDGELESIEFEAKWLSGAGALWFSVHVVDVLNGAPNGVYPGAILKSSAPMKIDNTQTSFTRFKLDDIDLNLVAGQKYGILIRGESGWANNSMSLRLMPLSTYEEGRLMGQYNFDVSNPARTNWWRAYGGLNSSDYDLMFRAEFAEVPEPSSGLLLMGIACGFVTLGRRKRSVG